MTENKSTFLNNELDLNDIFSALWSGRLIIISTTIIASVLIVIYSLSLPNIYTSKALLSPTVKDGNINDTLRNYSSVASFAGINLPSSGGSDTQEAIKILSSFKFYKENILKDIFLPNLMAIDSWNQHTNSISYDESIYDISEGEWVREVDFPKTTIPSAQESFKVFKENHFSITEDKENGFVSLYIKHQSPNIARMWLENITNSINETIREEQRNRSSLSINYLYKQMEKTNYAELRQVLSLLITKETEKLTLIESNKDYVFKIIDPAVSPELKSGPNRALICIIGSILGMLLGIIISLIIYLKNQPISSNN